MGTVTAYDMGSIQAALGGANPISLSEYYRGGAYVPTTRSTTTRDPASGQLFNVFYTGIGYTLWNASGANIQNPYTGPRIEIYWKVTSPGQGVIVLTNSYVSSYTSGTRTYYRGSLNSTGYDPYGAGGGSSYYIYTTVSGTTSINTGVPSSGSIAISQLYGAANP